MGCCVAAGDSPASPGPVRRGRVARGHIAIGILRAHFQGQCFKGSQLACYNLASREPDVTLTAGGLCKEIYSFYGPDNEPLCQVRFGFR